MSTTPTLTGADYLAKDYASFRRLMLDRLAVTLPDWQERNPADIGVALVELLAHAADQLSYFQDAVATEAYLGTARKRVSVRRHARLLDYAIDDGSNARAWVQIEVDRDALTLPRGTPLLTRIDAERGALHPSALDRASSEGSRVFETMHAVTLRRLHNELRFHTRGEERRVLPKGATAATLRDEGGGTRHLAVGDVLIFEEVRGPETGRTVDADPARRHAVRLVAVEYGEDPINSLEPGRPFPIVEVRWAFDDALPFDLCLDDVEDPAAPDVRRPISVARGNVVLADHGRTISELLDEVPAAGRYRPWLRFGPLTHQRQASDGRGRKTPFDPAAPAAAAVGGARGESEPVLGLTEDGGDGALWVARRDLLASDRLAREFVVEMEDDGRASLRFGDGLFGARPPAGSTLRATYRVGSGRAGNVGAEAIAHLVTAEAGIVGVRNPLPAAGGAEPESIEQIKLAAPEAFRVQERAVTPADYAAAAERHPEVQKAVASPRWTGSWQTLFLTIDRRGGLPIDVAFEAELRLFLERFRLAGHDLEIDAPRFVPLAIAMTVYVEPGYFRDAVGSALLEAFSNVDLPGGRRGFFHPDRFTFGQPVFLSQVVATAMGVPGVEWVDLDDTPPKPNRFGRAGEPSRGEVAEGRIGVGPLEIVRLDNDPAAPEHGTLTLELVGGL